jgi:hypothetical protein
MYGTYKLELPWFCQSSNYSANIWHVDSRLTNQYHQDGTESVLTGTLVELHQAQP